MMKITLNGAEKHLTSNITVSELLNEYNLKKSTVIVEINQTIIEIDSYETTSIHNGDRVELINFVGGG